MSPTFRGVVDWIAKNIAATHHKDHSAVSLRIAQRIACSLQRENARAIWKRQAELTDAAPVTVWTHGHDGGTW